MHALLAPRLTGTASALMLAVACAACSDEPARQPSSEIGETDPLLARALADPLMVDPDLAYRNEANAAITIRYDHPLPPLRASDELAERARNAAQFELLADGEILELPLPGSDRGNNSLAGLRSASAMVEAVGGPMNCAARLEEGLAWAARMPGPSSIMPHGMVQQAAGVEGAGCSLRVVRYLTPVSMDDALQYHFNRANRARLRPAVYASPERSLNGDGRTEHLMVHARPGSGGMSAIDLVYWTK